jgi:hypothetical protein
MSDALNIWQTRLIIIIIRGPSLSISLPRKGEAIAKAISPADCTADNVVRSQLKSSRIGLKNSPKDTEYWRKIINQHARTIYQP